MTISQFKTLPPNTKLYAWYTYEEGAVEVEACAPPQDAYISIKRVVPVDKRNQPSNIPLTHVFTSMEECEAHCLRTEEEFDSYCDAFTNIHTVFAHLLFNTVVGRVASEGELDALVHRISMILGCNAYELLHDYSNAICDNTKKEGDFNE